jgi:hypothetical protein
LRLHWLPGRRAIRARAALRRCKDELNRIKAAYDSKRGLLLTVPYTLYKGDGGHGTPGTVNVRINLSDKASVRIER